jgi:hypothetical protein
MLLANKVELSQSIFEGASFAPSMTTTFKCCECNKPNDIIIRPYVASGFHAFNDHYKQLGLTAEQIEREAIAQKNPQSLDFLGEYSVNNLHALVKTMPCSACQQQYLVVAGCGERQPGRMMCIYSGVWKIS